MAHKLYDHQTEAVIAIRDELSKVKRTLAVLATGSGKTMIYLHLANEWRLAGKRVLILAHRRELIHQPLDRAEQFFPALRKCMGVVMAKEDDQDAQIIVATVQTVARNRLENVKFDYIILDECHHGTAKMYMSLFGRWPGSKWLGLTATPFRHDGDSLSNVFESVAYRFPITAAVDAGILVPFDAYGFTLPISVQGITETMEGWDEKSLGSLLSAANAIEVVFNKWKEYCSDRKTIGFTASVGQAYATAKYFNANGVRAEAVDGSTPKKKRDGILRLFRAGKIQVVFNCQVWTEGVDVPEASAALMVCPTKSDLAYVQKLGRVLRTFPGKKDAIVLDFAPLEDRNIVMAGDILGQPRVERKAKEKAEKAGVLVRASRVEHNGLVVSVDPTTLIVEALTYLRKGFLAWSLQEYMAVAALSEVIMIAIELPNVERIAKAEQQRKLKLWDPDKERLYNSLKMFRIWVCKKTTSGWIGQFIAHCNTMEVAVDVGNRLVDETYRPSIAKKRKAWRSRPMSMPQYNYMKQLGIDIPDRCTQGQAAQLISHKIAERTVAKARPKLEIQILENDYAEPSPQSSEKGE